MWNSLIDNKFGLEVIETSPCGLIKFVSQGFISRGLTDYEPINSECISLQSQTENTHAFAFTGLRSK